MQVKKDEIKGLLGTIIFHILVVLVLLFMALRTPLPLPAEGGVEVNLGNSDQGMGTEQPREISAPAAASPPVTQQQKPDELLTDDTEEEAPAIEPKKERKPEPVKEQPKPVVKKETPPEPQQKVDPRAMFPGKGSTGKNQGQGGNEGITGKPGDQGNPFGTPDATGYEGTGGSGNGIGSGIGDGVSFNLSGRTSRSIPKPSTNFRESGIVVVTIYVDRNGNVTRATPGARGSTTSNKQLFDLAATAARKAKFSANENAAAEQKGTITYIFELN